MNRASGWSMAAVAIESPSGNDGELPHFMKVGRVRVQAKYIVLLQHNGLTSFSAVFDFDDGERLDKPGLASWRERRRVVLRDLGGDPHTFYLKRYVRPPWTQQVRRVAAGRLRQSTAAREWNAIMALAAAGIPVPVPVAFGQDICRGVERRSFLVIEEVPGASLESWLPANWRRDATGPVWRRQQEMVRGLARQVAAFHAAGFVHRDLYTSHIFLQDAAEGGPPGFTFIDLQRVFRPRWRRTRWVVKDLAALRFSAGPFISRTDRLRFWRQYIQSIRRSHWMKRLPARVEAKSSRIRRHHERRLAGETTTR
jgi:hypothetical protein